MMYISIFGPGSGGISGTYSGHVPKREKFRSSDLVCSYGKIGRILLLTRWYECCMVVFPPASIRWYGCSAFGGGGYTRLPARNMSSIRVTTCCDATGVIHTQSSPQGNVVPLFRRNVIHWLGSGMYSCL